MSKIFITGLILGIALPQYLSKKNYEILYKGVYFPHRNFNYLKRQKKKADLAMSYEDYEKYFKNTFSSLYNTFHYLFYGQFLEFLHMKQINCYRLIEQFEFVKETIENFDFIQENLKKIEEIQREQTIIPGSYKHMTLIENQVKELNKTADDYNLENLEKIKLLAKDDYEKYLLDNAVSTRAEYLKNIAPEVLVEKEKNKLQLIQNYHNSLKQFESEQRGFNMVDKFKLFRGKVNEKARDKMSEDHEKLKQKEENSMKSKKEVRVDKNVGEFKKPTPKKVDDELNLLKEIFGSK